MAVPHVELTRQQERMVTDGAALAQKAWREGSTDSRRALAKLLVDLRETFQDDRGRPDYRANSGGYKGAAARLYDLTGLNKEQREKLRWSVQHHVSGELVRRLGPEGCVAHGLSPEGKTERRRTRQREAATAPPTAAHLIAEAQRQRERAEQIEQVAREQGGCGLAELTPDLAQDLRANLTAVIALYGNLVTLLDGYLEKQDA